MTKTNLEKKSTQIYLNNIFLDLFMNSLILKCIREQLFILIIWSRDKNKTQMESCFRVIVKKNWGSKQNNKSLKTKIEFIL